MLAHKKNSRTVLQHVHFLLTYLKKILQRYQYVFHPNDGSKDSIQSLFPGYGNVSPRTAAGRAATVAYAAAGVPLTLACLAGLGASLARLARLAWLRATRGKVPNTWRKDGEVSN